MNILIVILLTKYLIRGRSVVSSVTVEKTKKSTIIHSIIGLAIMIGFRFLPLNLPEITPVGMQVVGIFIGTLYLWTFVDPAWASLMAIAMIGFSDYATMSAVITSAFVCFTLI